MQVAVHFEVSIIILSSFRKQHTTQQWMDKNAHMNMLYGHSSMYVGFILNSFR